MNDIDEYIKNFPGPVRELLEQVRKTIRKAAPDAAEKINYGIPTFTLNGNLVHFAAYKNHIGFYPTPSGIAAFREELSRYEGAKGSVKFPIDEPIPLDLIGKIVEFRVKETLEKADRKKNVKICPAGHTFFKSSDCPTCPICEKERIPAADFLSSLSAPARRALENKGIITLEALSGYNEEEILQLHGMGPASIPKLRGALEAKGLNFRN